MAQQRRSLGTANPLVYLGWLYLVQGIPYGLQDKFIPVQLRSLGLQYSSVSLLKLLLVPWLLKGVWAPLVEVVGGRIRWLVLSLLALAAASLAGSVTSPHDVWGLGMVLVCLNLGSAVQDVAVDGLALQVTPDHLLGLANTIQVVVYKIGSLVGGAGLTYLLALTSWSTTFTFLALLYGLTAVWALQITTTPPSTPSQPPQHSQDETKLILEHSTLEPSTANREKQIPVHLNQESSALLLYARTNMSVKHVQNITGKMDTGVNLLDGNASIEKSVPQVTAVEAESESISHVKRVSNILQEVFYSPGLFWLSCYVIVYKMGERGAINNMPLFLLDKGLSKEELAFWSGTVCQGLSILGSFYGGVILAKPNISMKSVLVKHSMYRFIAVLSQCLVVYILEGKSPEECERYQYILGIASLGWLSYSSGVISTASFTLMMRMSRECGPESQASHYSVVASLEVAGKLLFASLAGFIVDHQGMLPTFYLFMFLCTLPVLILTVMPLYLYSSRA